MVRGLEAISGSTGRHSRYRRAAKRAAQARFQIGSSGAGEVARKTPRRTQVHPACLPCEIQRPGFALAGLAIRLSAGAHSGGSFISEAADRLVTVNPPVFAAVWRSAPSAIPTGPAAGDAPSSRLPPFSIR